MPEINPLGNPECTYVQVANAIAARIQAGEFTHRLPAEKDFAREYGVAYQTLRHGIGLLRTRGLVITRQGRGNFVATRPASAQPARVYARIPGGSAPVTGAD